MNVKKYLEGYKIETADKLVSHIVELKRNTKPNLELISSLASHLPIMHDNEILEDSFKESRRENWKKLESWFCNTSDEERVKRYVYLDKKGVKQNQTEQKAPVFTYCKVNKNALEALSLRALYGHNKYKQFDKDWQNFTRVENGDFEYSNAEFRHALAIGGEETEEEHLIAAAWNAVARLEIYFRKKS